MVRLAVLLGTLSVAGPLAIFLNLPALPNIAADLSASQGQTEMTVAAYLIGMMAGQPLYGPASDKLGRRGPLVFGAAVFLAASVICALAPTLAVLIAGRVLQGIGAGAAVALSAAVVRDLYSDQQAAQLLALRLLVLGVAPIVAPALGAALLSGGSWRAVFWFTAVAGVVSLAATLLLPETHPSSRRIETRLGRSLSTYGGLLSQGRFLAPAICLAMVQVSFTAYLSGSSFVFIRMNHTAPWLYSLLLGVNACAYIGAAQLSPYWAGTYGPTKVVLAAVVTVFGAGVCVAGVAGLHVATPLVISGPLFAVMAGYGLAVSPVTVLALKDQGATMGTASALLSFLQWGGSAIGSTFVADFADGTALPMGLAIALGGFGGLASAIMAARLGRGERPFRSEAPVA